MLVVIQVSSELLVMGVDIQPLGLLAATGEEVEELEVLFPVMVVITPVVAVQVGTLDLVVMVVITHQEQVLQLAAVVAVEAEGSK